MTKDTSGKKRRNIFINCELLSQGKMQGEESKLGLRGRKSKPRLTCGRSTLLTLRPEHGAQFLLGCISDATAIVTCHFPWALNTSARQKEIGNVLISPITIEHFWGNQQPELGCQLISMLYPR